MLGRKRGRPRRVALEYTAETPQIVPRETPMDGRPEEMIIMEPRERPEKKPQTICGIGGCTTWYDDPVVMKRHYQRQHGIGLHSDLNQPKPMIPDSPKDPALKSIVR